MQEMLVTDVETACSILGQKNVIYGSQAASVWAQTEGVPTDQTLVYYSREQLEHAAELNGSKAAEWCLIPSSELTIAEIWRVRADRKKRPNLGDMNEHIIPWVEPWMDIKPRYGYELIDMKGRFESAYWDEQEILIAELGEDFQRAHDVAVLQALILLTEIHRRDRFLAAKHWGMLGSFSNSKLAIMPEANDRIHFEHTELVLEHDKLPVLVSLRPGNAH